MRPPASARSRAALTGVVLVLLAALPGAGAQVVNGGFETGDFSGWDVEEIAAPFYVLNVNGAGVDLGFGFFASEPSQGDWCALHGFDGGGPGSLGLSQVVTLPEGGPHLVFDHRAAWDLVQFGATLDRPFHVSVETPEGQELLRRTVLTAEAGSIQPDTGLTRTSLDLGDLGGQTVRLGFTWEVPESFKGPGFFQLDAVDLASDELPPGDRARLDGRVRFLAAGKDKLRLEARLTAPSGSLSGLELAVTLGGLERTVVLDEKGRGEQDDVQARVRPEPADAGLVRVQLRLSGDVSAELAGLGLSALPTGAAGQTLVLPFHLALGEDARDFQLPAVWTVKNGTGKVQAAADGGATEARLVLRRRAPPSESQKVSVRTQAPWPPGWSPPGQVVTVEVGAVLGRFVLDAEGRGVDGPLALSVTRERRRPAVARVVLQGKGAALEGALYETGLVDVQTPKGGVPLLVPCGVDLGGRHTEILVPTMLRASEGKRAVARGRG